MVEAREYTNCIECGTHVVRIRDTDSGIARHTIHTDPLAEAAQSCALNPAALPGLRTSHAS